MDTINGHYYFLDSFIKGVLLGILDYDYIIFSKPVWIVSNQYLFKVYKNYIDKNFLHQKTLTILYLSQIWKHGGTRIKNLLWLMKYKKYSKVCLK